MIKRTASAPKATTRGTVKPFAIDFLDTFEVVAQQPGSAQARPDEQAQNECSQ